MPTNELPLLETEPLSSLVEAEALPPLNDAAPEITEAITLQWDTVKALWDSGLQRWTTTVQPLTERAQSTLNQGVDLLTSEIAQTHYRRTFKIVGTVLTLSAITLLYLGIACYLAGATCRKLLIQNSEHVTEVTSTLEVEQVLQAIARLPLTTQEATEEMIGKAEVAIAQSRQLLIPMRRFVEQVAQLYQPQPKPNTIVSELTAPEAIHRSEAFVSPPAIAVLPEVSPAIDTNLSTQAGDGFTNDADMTPKRKDSTTKQRRSARLASLQTPATPVLTSVEG